ncbi:MAG: hypothetical protein J0H44_18075 [Alphaproteobacteria bacterium]|nr:hypothetical protein [Alphaproteobacteria bacterium]
MAGEAIEDIGKRAEAKTVGVDEERLFGGRKLVEMKLRREANAEFAARDANDPNAFQVPGKVDIEIGDEVKVDFLIAIPVQERSRQRDCHADVDILGRHQGDDSSPQAGSPRVHYPASATLDSQVGDFNLAARTLARRPTPQA